LAQRLEDRVELLVMAGELCLSLAFEVLKAPFIAA
jgi:hypothetical protein